MGVHVFTIRLGLEYLLFAERHDRSVHSQRQYTDQLQKQRQQHQSSNVEFESNALVICHP